MGDHLPDGFPGDIGAMVGQAMGQMRAALEDVMTERYQYKRVPWEQVNELARQGWLLLPIWGGYWGMGDLLFVMSRKLGPADDAERMLAEQAAPKEPR